MPVLEVETDAPDTDDHGIPVQPHAAEVFAARPLFDELLKKLRECRKLYHELAEHPGGILLQSPSASINARDRWKHKGLENAIMALEDRRPAMTVCPFSYNEHLPHPDECTLCGGRHWTAPFTTARVPAELLQRVKEEFGVS